MPYINLIIKNMGLIEWIDTSLTSYGFLPINQQSQDKISSESNDKRLQEISDKIRSAMTPVIHKTIDGLNYLKENGPNTIAKAAVKLDPVYESVKKNSKEILSNEKYQQAIEVYNDIKERRRKYIEGTPYETRKNIVLGFSAATFLFSPVLMNSLKKSLFVAAVGNLAFTPEEFESLKKTIKVIN
ncbi:unnamed protein product [Blepharisma stoltei]|uniref:Uncharacterized protein n=1 Tax=Blepharisma stoltei TaxID=1481888 RepID=A0AAU9K419_9CILI|nr:unnamed protein product [Blepharisma stoltei]